MKIHLLSSATVLLLLLLLPLPLPADSGLLSRSLRCSQPGK